MGDLVRIRAGFARVILAFMWVDVALMPLASWVTRGEFALMATAASAIVAGALTLFFLATKTVDRPMRVLFAVSSMTSVALLVGQLAGDPWQSDVHMYFFAMIAVLIGLADWLPIAVAAGLVVLHHLLLNFLAPAFVFNEPALGRVLLHAVIVSVQAGASIWLCHRLVSLMTAADLQAERVATEGRRAAEAAQAASAEAAKTEAALQKQALLIDQLDSVIGGVVEAAQGGCFDRRAAQDLDDPALRSLGGKVDQLVETVDRALADFAVVLARLAEGDLTSRIERDYQGRFDELKASLNRTLIRLTSTMSSIQATTGQVTMASDDIGAGAADLASRTKSQAASLKEAAMATEGLSAVVGENARRSGEASRQAAEARQIAERGGGIAVAATEAMTRIEQASGRIADILGTIDDIAFQTNLLALNAAVEAARAGDAGKGFAVVASEVRTLAQRSGQAAKDIRVLIADTNRQVVDGVALVRTAGDALGQIVAAAQRVADTVAAISSANEGQAAGITDMSRMVASMDAMTGQNSSLAVESAASAGSLGERVRGLKQMVEFFRTDRPDPELEAAGLESSPTPVRLVRPKASRSHRVAPATVRSVRANGNAMVG